MQGVFTIFFELVLAVLCDVLGIPAGVPSRAPQHQLGLRRLGGRPARWLRSALHAGVEGRGAQTTPPPPPFSFRSSRPESR